MRPYGRRSGQVCPWAPSPGTEAVAQGSGGACTQDGEGSAAACCQVLPVLRVQPRFLLLKHYLLSLSPELAHVGHMGHG